MTTTAPDEPLLDDYPLGRSDHETQRLILQHQIYAPITRQLLRAAGVSTGMKVLDVGSGAGDVALLLADLVGPTGEVVGVDMSDEALAGARARMRAAGRTNVRFVVGDLRRPELDLDVGDDFDAVVGRWVLMYIPEPAELLARLRRHLRPGGVAAFQESDLVTPMLPYPPAPLHERVYELMMTPPPPGAVVPQVELQMGPKLFTTFVEAGFPPPQLRLEAPLGGGPDWPGYAYLASTARTVLMQALQLGVTVPDDLDLDSLEDRLRDEIVERNGMQPLRPVVGAWARAQAR